MFDVLNLIIFDDLLLFDGFDCVEFIRIIFFPKNHLAKGSSSKELYESEILEFDGFFTLIFLVHGLNFEAAFKQLLKCFRIERFRFAWVRFANFLFDIQGGCCEFFKSRFLGDKEF